MKRHCGSLQKAGVILEQWLRGLAKPEYSQLTRLWQHWPMVMGPELASMALPLGHHKGILLVGGEDAMTMQELSLMSEEILERANAFMAFMTIMDAPFFHAVKVRLALGKTPLDVAVQLPKVIHPPAPQHILRGTYLGQQDSSAARCYARYVARSQRIRA